MMGKPTAIVTGGAQGIGLVIAKELSKRDCNTVIFDIDSSNSDTLSSDGLYFVKVDVTREAEVLRAVHSVVNEYGAIDVLINNAGTIMSHPLINIMDRENPRHSYELFVRNIDVNLQSVFLVGSIVAEKMVMNRTKGVIINISSVCAAGNAGQSAYSAAKAGVEALTRVWSKELGIFGIRVAAIAPGFIDTESTKQALDEQKIRDIRNRTPLRRLGAAQNIAHAAITILENDFINGSIIAVDGGIAI